MTDDEVIDVLVRCGYQRETILHAPSAPDTTDVLTFPLIDVENWEVEWRTLRALVSKLDRWPVLTHEPQINKGVPNLRWDFDGKGSQSAAEAIALAADYNAEEIFDSYQPTQWDESLTPFEYLVEFLRLDNETKARWHAEATTALGQSPSLRDLERWLVAKQVGENKRHPMFDSENLWKHVGEIPRWMALVPGTDPINGLVYVSAYGARPVMNLAVSRRWVVEHEVELVGAVSCGFMFEMPRPISDPDEAWRLAIEILGMWFCSSGGAPAGVTPMQLAPALTDVTRFDGTVYP